MADTKISALTAASALDGTEVYPATQSSLTNKVTGAQIKTWVRQAGSATAGTWPIRGSGTVLTTAVAGGEEYDGTVAYFSPAASSRAVDLCEYFCCLGSAYQFPTSTGNQQKLFNGSANGTLTLPTATYLFDMMVYLTAMSSTSGNGLIDIKGGGTATVASVLFQALGVDGAAPGATNMGHSLAITNASPASVVTATIQTALYVSLRGAFRITGAGTIIPSITLVTASQATVAAGSYFRCRPIGSTTFASCGNWS